jgi:hypothetical protein
MNKAFIRAALTSQPGDGSYWLDDAEMTAGTP